MSDTVKLIIEIPKRDYEEIKKVGTFTFPRLSKAIREATTLDDVKAEIEKLNPVDYGSMFSYESHNGARDMQSDILDILDNIGKAESEDKK